jgi:hypothetical protein
MGNNNLMITEMFEEIKTLLASVEKKLDDAASKNSRSNPDIEQRSINAQPKVDLQKLEQIFKAIYAYLQNSDYKTSETNQRIGDSEKRILSQLQEIKYSIDTQEKERIVRHFHLLDRKSYPIIIKVLVISIFLTLSILMNLHLMINNNKMKENHLKYLFIKSRGGINSNELKKLDKTFDYQEDNGRTRK